MDVPPPEAAPPEPARADPAPPELPRPNHLLRFAAIYDFLSWASLAALGILGVAASVSLAVGAWNGPPSDRAIWLVVATFVLVLGLGVAGGLFALFHTAAGAFRELAGLPRAQH